MAAVSTISQSTGAIDQALTAVTSVVKRSATNPLGDARPITPIQPGKTASGKKLPPTINKGNSNIDEMTLAVF